MYYFCTYFDHHYLSRGLALYQSLRRHCVSFELWVLCMDRLCYDILSQTSLSNVHLIALEDFERGDEELLRAKHDRTLMDYYFTCTPSLPLLILNNNPAIDIITYLDADLFFFGDPGPIYAEMNDNSIGIIGHRFPQYLRYLEQHGIYNVGWVSFRRDEHATACLRWWRERVIEWCQDQCDGGRFADQKYLDNWPELFPRVAVLQHKGANLAPWNLANYKISRKGNSIWVDEHPLIFFHFHGFKQIKGWLYDPNLACYKATLSEVVRHGVYAPYILTLLDVSRRISPLLETVSVRSSIRGGTPMTILGGGVKRLRRLLQVLLGVVSHQYIVTMKGRVV